MSGCSGSALNSYGDKCLFYCKYGYKPISGTKERHCQEDGSWSGSPLTCEGMFSELFKVFLHGLRGVQLRDLERDSLTYLQ